MEQPAPSLLSLCFRSVANQLLGGDDVIFPDVYELPSHIFDALMARLPPLSLHKLLDEMPEGIRDEYVSDGTNCPRNPSFNDAWRSLCQQRWKFKLALGEPVDWLDAYNRLFFQKGEDEAEEAALLRSLSGLRWQELLDQNQPVDWHRAYCRMHLQNCLDQAAGDAGRPSFDGKMGEIRISDDILEFLGCEGQTDTPTSKFSQLYQHCERFAPCLRSLELQDVLCVEETCHLLKNSRLERLILWGSRMRKHVSYPSLQPPSPYMTKGGHIHGHTHALLLEILLRRADNGR